MYYSNEKALDSGFFCSEGKKKMFIGSAKIINKWNIYYISLFRDCCSTVVSRMWMMLLVVVLAVVADVVAGQDLVHPVLLVPGDGGSQVGHQTDNL